MEAEEWVMLGILAGSLFLAIPITMGIWPPVKRRLEKTRIGRLGFTSGRTGRKMVFLLHAVVWLLVMAMMLLIWAGAE